MLVILHLPRMGPVGLVEPAVTNLYLTITRATAVSYYKVIAQPPLPTPLYPVKVVKGIRTPRRGSAMVNHYVLPLLCNGYTGYA